jgi:uncharacterized protein YjbI with pentapeptide repeats
VSLAEPSQIELLKKGRGIWNEWRRSEPNLTPDLRQANLVRAELSGAALQGARLEGARLIRARLRAANLSGASLEDATLIEADLSQAELTGARFERANLANAVLRGASLAGAVFQHALLTVADLREADCRGTDFSRADLRESALGGANLAEARLDQALLHGTHLEGVDLSLARGLTQDQVSVATTDARTRLPFAPVDSSADPRDLESLRQDLAALRARVPEGGRTGEREVAEFHRLLARLETLGHDVSRFRVPEEALGTDISWEYTSGGAAFEMDGVRSIDALALLSRIDALISHLKT